MFKRLMFGTVALVVLLAVYAVYVLAFSHLALPQLDPDDWIGQRPPKGPPPDNPEPLDYARSIAAKVFGKDSWQATADIALYWRNRGVIIFVKDYNQVGSRKDQFQLVPFSLLYAVRSESGGAEPQYVTLEGKEAVLQFDRPLDFLQAQGARPTGGRISGDVRIQLDRGTAEPEDDIIVYVDDLNFDDTRRKVWTDGPVRIVAQDAVATALGAEVELKQPDESQKPSGKFTFQGVREAVLLQDVQVDMITAADGGLLAGPNRPADRSRPAKPVKKIPVRITCQGPFFYDLDQATARFTRSVRMVRETGESQFDRLFCDDFRAVFETSRASEEPRTSAGKSTTLKFREAHASGGALRVYSDAQAAEATGTELHYDADTGQMILRGTPEVVATQAGNIIHGQEITTTRTDDDQRIAAARGPGWIEARDKQTGDVMLYGRWKDSAQLEPQKDQVLLVLKGEAEAELPNRGSLSAERLRIWLEPAKPGTRPARSGADRDAGSYVPSRIEAVTRAVARSDQFDIQADDRVEIVFEDAPATATAPAGQRSETPIAPKGASRGGKRTGQSVGAADAGTASDESVSGPTLPPIGPGRAPVRLVAGNVRVKALRVGSGVELSEVSTEGGVHLVQPPDEPGGTGNSVRGQTMHLQRVGQANVIKVTGAPAQVEMKELRLEGPSVAVDQPSGVAWVEGKGMMVLPSDTDLEGRKLETPTELSIRWGSDMFFDGAVADFDGGVEARQGTSVVRCRRLGATLSERIDIADPKKKGGSSARIESLVCHDAVQLDNMVRQDGRLEKLDHLEATELKFNNANGQIEAYGPGLVRSYTREGGTFGVVPPAAPAKKAAEPAAAAGEKTDQLYLTEIRFTERMEGNRRHQEAKFHGRVGVIHTPVTDEEQAVDDNNIPPGGMRMACQELGVGSKVGPDDQPYHILYGTGNVDVEAREFNGRADRISYNQLYDRLIFESHPGGFATLWQQKRRGEKWDEFRGRKLWYFRRDGRVTVEDGTTIDFSDPQADKRSKQKAAGRN